MLASSAVLDVLFWWLRNLGDPEPTWYSVLWPWSMAWMVGCKGAAVLQACKPRWWVAVPALGVHAIAAGYPQRFPGSLLELEIHAVAFCCLLFGWALLIECRTCKERLRVAVLSALFLGTAATYYELPWAMWLRPWLMWYQSICYLALAETLP